MWMIEFGVPAGGSRAGCGSGGLKVREVRPGTVEVSSDVLGRRRIYYQYRPGILRVTTELAELLDADHAPVLDHGVMGFFLQHGLTPATRTPFAGIRKVPAGHSLVVDTATLRAHTTPASELRDLSPDPSASLEQVVEAVRQEIRHCGADAVALSGGLDSTYLLALINSGSRRVPAVAVAAAGGRDESAWQRLAADHARAEIFGCRTPLASYGHLLDAAVRVLPDPVGHHVIASYAAAYELVHRLRLRSCASGDGAEEVFDRETHQVRTDRSGRLQPSRISFDLDDITLLLMPGGQDTRVEELESEQHAWSRSLAGAADPIFVNNLFFHLSGFQLHPQDRLARARGIEPHWPFLAWRAVLPNLTRKNLVVPADNGKQALRAAARGIIPDEIIDRPKVGLSSSFETWVRAAGKRTFAERVAACGLFSLRGREVIERLLAEHGEMTGKGHSRPLSCAYLLASWWLFWVANLDPDTGGPARPGPA
jgi:asparagine synthase (glutamine-hydrolysing)